MLGSGLSNAKASLVFSYPYDDNAAVTLTSY